MTSTKTCKLVMLGDSGVGKSSLVGRYINGNFFEFQEPTIGAAFNVKNLNIDGKPVKLEIWDTAGQERYKSLEPMYYRGAQIALICYDMTSHESFQGAKIWFDEIDRKGPPGCVKILVGTKVDLVASRNVFDASEWASTRSVTHFHTSAKNERNVNSLFKLATEKGSEVKYGPEETRHPQITREEITDRDVSCCGIV
jgi:small GTP-binding protein